MARQRFAEHRLYMAMALSLGREPSEEEFEEFEEFLTYVKHREEFLAWKARHARNGSAGHQP
jgi:hypothetical protein